MPSLIPPIHNDGWRFVIISFAITVFLFTISKPLGWLGVVFTLWVLYFFRNPYRIVPQSEDLMVSPASGQVCLIQKVIPPEDYELGSDERYRVSIFLNVFDVHVNRIPLGGVIKKIIYHPGSFLNASFDKASDENERQTLIIDSGGKKQYAVVQIAGLIARRIRCDVHADDEVRNGEVYGLIRFGSRVDIYLPVGAIPAVIKGQRVTSGESIVCDLGKSGKLPEGEML